MAIIVREIDLRESGSVEEAADHSAAGDVTLAARERESGRLARSQRETLNVDYCVL